MEEKVRLEDKIIAVSCKVSQLGAIAFVAENTTLNLELCERIFKDVLCGIKALSEQIVANLDKIIDEEYVV